MCGNIVEKFPKMLWNILGNRWNVFWGILGVSLLVHVVFSHLII